MGRTAAWVLEESFSNPTPSVNVTGTNTCVLAFVATNSGDASGTVQFAGVNFHAQYDMPKGYFGQDTELYVFVGVPTGVGELTGVDRSGVAAIAPFDDINQTTPVKVQANGSPDVTGLTVDIGDLITAWAISLGDFTGEATVLEAPIENNNNENIVIQEKVAVATTESITFTTPGGGNVAGGGAVVLNEIGASAPEWTAIDGAENVSFQRGYTGSSADFAIINAPLESAGIEDAATIGLPSGLTLVTADLGNDEALCRIDHNGTTAEGTYNVSLSYDGGAATFDVTITVAPEPTDSITLDAQGEGLFVVTLSGDESPGDEIVVRVTDGVDTVDTTITV